MPRPRHGFLSRHDQNAELLLETHGRCRCDVPGVEAPDLSHRHQTLGSGGSGT
jgi:hypothetical protein